MSRHEDRQFAEFRRTGATEALASAFDETAPELWRIAWYLTGGDRHRAEDALQATFLSAIEDRARWDSQRPLRPWLLGILGNHVRNERRRSSRLSSNPDVLDALPDEQRPSDGASRAEVRELVSKAMQELASPYREVVILHLEHGLTAQEIATAIDRKPGTVRTQVVRGLEALRKALPTGIAGGVFLMPEPEVTSQVIAGVREAVVAHGSVVAATLPTTIAIHASWKSTTMIASFLIGAAALAFTFWPETEPPPATPVTVSQSHPQSSTTTADSETSRTLVEEVARTVEAPDEAVAPSDQDADERRFTVTVVDPDGQPIADAQVIFNANDQQQYARTDSTGRTSFALHPSVDYYQVALTTQPTMEYFSHVMSTFGGDVVLEMPPGMQVDIRVVDQNGAPVANAFVEGILANQWDRMFNPIGRTGPDGVLHLPNVQPRGGQIRAYAHGHQLSGFHDFSGQAGDTIETELRLRGPAVSVSGDVVDEHGELLPGAEVAVIQFGDRSTVQYTECGDDGRFRMDWLEPGRHMLVARAFDGDIWRLGARRFEHRGGIEPEVQLQLTPGAELSGQVTDAAGNPLHQVGVYAEFSTVGTHSVPFTERSLRTDADGRYRLTGLLPGTNRLRADLDDSEVRTSLTLNVGSANEWNPVLEAAQPISVRLIDERGEPLVGWRVSMLGEWGTATRGMETDEEGHAGVDAWGWKIPPTTVRGFWLQAPVPEAMTGLNGEKFDFFPTLVVPPLPPSREPHVIRVSDTLRLTASVTGRVLGPRSQVPERASIEIQSSKIVWGSGWETTVWAESDGTFEIAPLSPGDYNLRIRVDGGRTFVRAVHVDPDQRLDLGDVIAPTTGRLTIQPTQDGTATVARGLRMIVRHSSGAGWYGKRQDDGSYTVDDAYRGTATVTVWGDEVPSRTHDIEVGETTRVEVELPQPVAPTAIQVALPPDHEIHNATWSGTLSVRDAETRALVLEKRLGHSFRGFFTPTIEFSAPLEDGHYEVELVAWNKRRVVTEVRTPTRAIRLELPGKGAK